MKDLIILIVVVVGGLFLAFAGANMLVGATCMASYTEYNPNYSFLEGCRIEYDGKLTPVTMVKNINY